MWIIFQLNQTYQLVCCSPLVNTDTAEISSQLEQQHCAADKNQNNSAREEDKILLDGRFWQTLLKVINKWAASKTGYFPVSDHQLGPTNVKHKERDRGEVREIQVTGRNNKRGLDWCEWRKRRWEDGIWTSSGMIRSWSAGKHSLKQ